MSRLHLAFRPFARKFWRGWRLLVLTVVVVLIAAGVYLHWDSPLNRAWVEHALAQRYHAEVTIGEFHSSLFPRAHISGSDLAVRRRGSVSKLATIAHFSANAQWWRILFGTRRLGHVYLRGMVVNLVRHAPPAPPHTAPPTGDPSRAVKAVLVLDRITIDQLLVHVFAPSARRPTRTFTVPHLHLEALPGGQGTRFDINLTLNHHSAKAHGAGQFGPWNRNHPEATPLSGRYDLSGLNLSVFGPLHGTLAAHGELTGAIGNLAISGDAETPDIGAGRNGGALPLHAHFQVHMLHLGSMVTLQNIAAVLGQSPLTVKGDVRSTPQGHHTSLSIAVGSAHQPARVQDIARLLSRAIPPAATGRLAAHAQLSIAPGPLPVKMRLQLQGAFRIWQARIARPKVEQKIATLSRRGQGKHGKPPASDPAPDFTSQGPFHLQSGILRLPHLQFAVPGAVARLHGAYALTRDQIHLQGTLALAAKPAQLATGVKSLLLRLIGPLIENGNHGTHLPITISGSRHHPKFSLNTKKIFS